MAELYQMIRVAITTSNGHSRDYGATSSKPREGVTSSLHINP